MFFFRRISFVRTLVLVFFAYSCGFTITVSKEDKNNTEIKNSTEIERPKIPKSKEEYIEIYKKMALDKMEKYRIPASITLAQGIIESDAGNSKLAINANNHFGIKCGSRWNDMVYYKDDDEKNECFRVYRRVDESFDDHSEILLMSRYKRLFDLEIDDYRGWAKGLKDCGYATNPKYPQILVNIIERYKLYEYDNIYLAESKKYLDKRDSGIDSSFYDRERRDIVNNDTIRVDSTTIDGLRSEENKSISEKKASEINISDTSYDKESRGIVTRKTVTSFITVEEKKTPSKIHKVEKGETLYSISKRYNIPLKDIREYNNMDEDNRIYEGQELIIRQ